MASVLIAVPVVLSPWYPLLFQQFLTEEPLARPLALGIEWTAPDIASSSTDCRRLVKLRRVRLKPLALKNPPLALGGTCCQLPIKRSFATRAAVPFDRSKAASVGASSLASLLFTGRIKTQLFFQILIACPWKGR